MFTAFGGQLSASLIVLRHQPGTEQEGLVDFGDGARGKAQPRGDHVQPGVALAQDAEVLLIAWPQTQAVESASVDRPAQGGQA